MNQSNVLAMLPLSSKQEREIERLYRNGYNDRSIAIALSAGSSELVDQREMQIKRYLDRQFPQYRQKNLQGA